MNPDRRHIITAGCASILPAALWAEPAARLTDPKKLEAVSFEDLFHLPEKDADGKLSAEKVKTLRAALEDFNAALAYREPAHAKRKESFRDGGTTVYDGDGYSLVIWKALSKVSEEKSGTIAGYLYGPELRIKPEWDWGGPCISRVTFYPTDVLKRLLG